MKTAHFARRALRPQVSLLSFDQHPNACLNDEDALAFWIDSNTIETIANVVVDQKF